MQIEWEFKLAASASCRCLNIWTRFVILAETCQNVSQEANRADVWCEECFLLFYPFVFCVWCQEDKHSGMWTAFTRILSLITFIVHHVSHRFINPSMMLPWWPSKNPVTHTEVKVSLLQCNIPFPVTSTIEDQTSYYKHISTSYQSSAVRWHHGRI